MRVFAISDLHLPAREKPMSVFGAKWDNHFARISEDWLSRVDSSDIVLLPGDITWAMRLEDAMEDLNKIAALPGTKILLRGNHDYWWSSIGRLREALPKSMLAIQNDALLIEGVLFAGTRLWNLPTGDLDENDIKIYERERIRLEMSLKSARRLSNDAPLCVMAHYPPFSAQHSGYSDIIERYSAAACVYGHLHGSALQGAFSGVKNGVVYYQVSCDGLDFKLMELQGLFQ